MLLARKWILMENPKLFFDGKVAIVRRAVPFELFLHVVIMKQLWGGPSLEVGPDGGRLGK